MIACFNEQLTDQVDGFTRNTIYLKLGSSIKVECKINHIRQAVIDDVTVFEAFCDFQQYFGVCKRFNSIGTFLDLLFKNSVIEEKSQLQS